MLSSNMAASIATEINIYLCKHLFALLCVTVSPWTSPFVVQVHDDRVGAWLPWISRSVCTIRRPCWRTAWRQWKRSTWPSCNLYMWRSTISITNSPPASLKLKSFYLDMKHKNYFPTMNLIARENVGQIHDNISLKKYRAYSWMQQCIKYHQQKLLTLETWSRIQFLCLAYLAYLGRVFD